MLGQDLRLLLLQALQDARVALQQAQQRAHRVPRRLVACQRIFESTPLLQKHAGATR